MKIEKLTDNKIRIIINLEELSEQNIDIFNLPNSKEKIYELNIEEKLPCRAVVCSK